MKRTLYTIAFVALLGAFANAQDNARQNNGSKQDNAKQDNANVNTNNGAKQDNAKTNDQGGGGTRMAVTKKGLPASKGQSSKEAKEVKPNETKPQPASEKN